jgi:O-antigen biosynthesis protein
MGEIFPRERADLPLSFTGERLTSDVGGQIELEHFHRYFLARDLCRGKEVLDIASGEGYGSAFLSQVAKRVIGVDVDVAAVDHAKTQYARSNLAFVKGSALDIPIPAASVDIVVSFETIEHFYDHGKFLSEVKRVLKPGGLFIVSTPERDIYSPANSDSNPYHVKEMTRAEFESILSEHFGKLGVLVQRVILGSVLVPDSGFVSQAEALTIERRGDKLFELSRGLPRSPYLLAIASDKALPSVGPSFYIENGYVQREDTTLRAELVSAQLALENERSVATRFNSNLEASNQRHEVEMHRIADSLSELSSALIEERSLALAAKAALEEERSRSKGLLHSLNSQQNALDEQRALLDQERSAAEQLKGSLRKADDALVEERAAHADAVQSMAHMMAHSQRLEIDKKGAESDLEEMRSRLTQVLEERRAVLGSTTWLMMKPVRMLVHRTPRGARVFCRRVLRLIWWTVSFQLSSRLRHRRELLKAAGPKNERHN